jgi:hypothetical protein
MMRPGHQARGGLGPGSASLAVLAARYALPSRHWPHSGLPAGP